MPGRHTTGPVLISGHRLPVFNKGPQLMVTGEPGRLTAKDVRRESAFAGATLEGTTLEDLLAAAGADPAQSSGHLDEARAAILEAHEHRPSSN